MTSSKKAKKPSSSFKKAGWGQVTGQGDTSFNNDSTLSNEERGRLAAQNYRNLRADQDRGERREQRGLTAPATTVQQPATSAAGAPQTSENIETATPQQRGVTAAETNVVHGGGAPDSAARREAVASENTRTGADAATGLDRPKKDAARTLSDHISEERRTNEEAEAEAENRAKAEAEKKKWVEEAVAEERKKAAAEKRRFDPDEARERFSKEYDERKKKEAQSAEEMNSESARERRDARNKKFRDDYEWAINHGWTGEKARKWAMDRAEAYADDETRTESFDKYLEEATNNGMSEEEAKKWAQDKVDGDKRHLRELADEAYDEYEKEALAKGMDPEEAKQWALEKSEEDAEKQVDYELHKDEYLAMDRAASQRRVEMFSNLYKDAADALSGIGKAGEYINKGLDIAKGILHTMLYPSPLGINETQTAISAAAESLNVANDLVQDLSQKVGEKVGKSIVNNMTISMGKIIGDNVLKGKNIEDMSAEELEYFTKQLDKAWQPFLDRLDMIGADNPAGAMLAEKFKKTYGMIQFAAKNKKKEAMISKKKFEQTIRRKMRERKEKAEDKREEIVEGLREKYKDASVDPQTKLFWDLAEQVSGKYPRGLKGEIVAPDGSSLATFSWLLDPTLTYYDPDLDDYAPTPRLAGKVLDMIDGIKASMPDMYARHKDDYDAVERDMMRYQAGPKVESQRAKVNAATEYWLDGYREPDEMSPADRVTRFMELGDKDYAQTRLIGGKISLDKNYLARLDQECMRTRVHFSAEKAKRPLTVREQNQLNAAINTQNLIRSIGRMQALKKQIEDKTFTMRGAQRFEKNPDGTDKIDPATGEKIPVLDDLGRPTYDSYAIPDNKKGDYVRVIDRAIEKAIENTAIVDADYDAVSPIAIVDQFSDPTKGMYAAALWVQRDIQWDHPDPARPNYKVKKADFPDVVGDPEGPYAQRVGNMDFIKKMNELWTGKFKDKNGNIVTRNYGDVMFEGLSAINKHTKKIEGLVKGLQGITNGTRKDLNGRVTPAIVNSISATANMVRVANDSISALPEEFVNSLEGEESIKKIKGAFKEAIEAYKGILGNGGIPDDLKNKIEAGINTLEEINNKLGKDLDLDERLRDVINGLYKYNDGAGGGGGEGGKRTPPGWLDGATYSTAIAWNANMDSIDRWSPDTYWDNYNTLLAVLENMPDDGTREYMEKLGRDAYIRGMIGEIYPVGKDENGNTTYAIRSATQKGEGDANGSVLVPKLGVKITDKMVIGPDGKRLSLDLGDGKGERYVTPAQFQLILDKLYKSQHGGENNTMGAWRVDKGKDAMSKEGLKKLMVAILKASRK